jgi:hypothetical protein
MEIAPSPLPGQIIPPFSHPKSIKSKRQIAYRNLGVYVIKVLEYKCAIQHRATEEEIYQVVTILQGDMVLFQHPVNHQAGISFQASVNLFNNHLFYFTEHWMSRVMHGEVLLTYDAHLTSIDITNLLCLTHVHQVKAGEQDYGGVDVDASQQYLLITTFDYETLVLHVMQKEEDNLLELDCSELWGIPLLHVHWGDTIEKLRYFNTHDLHSYEVPIDWDKRRVLREPTVLLETQSAG